MEEYAIILDYMPTVSGFSKKDPLCYAVGDNEFKLFELVPKTNAKIELNDKVYIGKDAKFREQIDHVKRRIGFDELTSTAQKELDYVVYDIVKANPDKFVKFYNNAGPISIKKHLLEELPGLGKKTVEEIVKARNAGKFKDFEDLETRVPAVKDAAKLIANRIVLEISDSGRRHYLFIVK